MKTLPLASLLALTLAAPVLAAEPLDTAIHRRLNAEGPWLAPAEDAFIRTRCGIPAGAPLRNIDIDGDVLTCPDGRTVKDPHVRAIAAAVSRRANERVRAVMASPEVRKAMALTVGRSVREALAAKGLAPPR